MLFVEVLITSYKKELETSYGLQLLYYFIKSLLNWLYLNTIRSVNVCN